MLIVNQPGLKVNQLAGKWLHKFAAGKYKCVCGGTFIKHDSYKRSVINQDKEFEVRVPRVCCNNCGKTHGLLPDFIGPYQRYTEHQKFNLISSRCLGIVCEASVKTLLI